MWIKICGVNDPVTARAIGEVRPDAIGLNFYEGSVRCVTCDVAGKIVGDLPSEIEAIGVFVDPSAGVLQKTVEDCGLSGIQCHASGDDDSLSELLETREGRSVKRVRAFRIGPQGLASLERYFARAGRRARVDACLVDSHVEGRYGGTGQTVSWELLRKEYRRQEWPPLILAGGLRPENVAEAIELVRPWGVDVASGVESSPGVKDPELVARFIEEARRAFSTFSAAPA
jgi:phosphoribosylanthranilate isomerase